MTTLIEAIVYAVIFMLFGAVLTLTWWSGQCLTIEGGRNNVNGT